MALVRRGRKRYKFHQPTEDMVRERRESRKTRRVRRYAFRPEEHTRPSKNEENYCYLSSVVAPRPWEGQPAFIIGGGPSLKHADLSCLDGHLTIGTNRSIEIYDSSLLFSVDTRFLRWLLEERLGEKALPAYKNSLATKVWLQVFDEWEFEDEPIVLVDRNPGILWADNLEDGIPGHMTNNSGLAALGLATMLGASPIYLLGIDMRDPKSPGGGTWWHNGYPTKQSSTVYSRRMAPRWEKAAGIYRDHNVEVINLNPESAVMGFPKQDYGALERLRIACKPIVVGFYTQGTEYADEALRMAQSAHRFGFKTDLHGFKSLGSWWANTSYKPEFLLTMLDKYPGQPLVYVDADGRFVRYPKLFDELNASDKAIGVHYRAGKEELLSGTIWLSGSPRCREIVKEWANECANNPGKWDQRMLQKVLQNKQDEVEQLPADYTAIFDLMRNEADNPAIMHYQASRRLRFQV